MSELSMNEQRKYAKWRTLVACSSPSSKHMTLFKFTSATSQARRSLRPTKHGKAAHTFV